VFKTTITSATQYPTLFNTGEISSMPAPGTPSEPNRTTHTFAPTPPMATYLFGAMVGELESIEGVYKRGAPGNAKCGRLSEGQGGTVGPSGEDVLVRVWGRIGQSSSLTLARDACIAGISCARPDLCQTSHAPNISAALAGCCCNRQSWQTRHCCRL
jgi:hypothetical protein